MPQTKAKKEQIVADLSELLKGSKLLVFSDPTRVSTNEIRNLRSQLSKTGAKYKLVKKTLLNRALNKEGLEELAKGGMFKESVAIMVLPEINLDSVKALYDFQKKNKDKFHILGGWLENKILNIPDVNNLAKLPAKEILLGQLVWVLVSPMRSLAFVLQNNIQKFVIILGRIKTA